MKKPSAVVGVLVLLCNLVICASLAFAADLPAVDDGRSDYRFAISPESVSVEHACVHFESKYVHDHVVDKSLKVEPGDTVSIFLKNAYFASVRGFFSTTSEAAVLLNADVNAPLIKKATSDYGKVIYYSEAVSEKSPINASFVPAISIVTSVDSDVVSLDTSVVQFDSQNSVLARNILKSMVSLASASASPAAAAVLATLGTQIATSPAAGTRTTQYRMAFVLEHPSSKVRQPILREGDLVLITSTRDASLNWPKLYYDHRSGSLYSDDKCSAPLTGVDYLVFTLRRNISLGLDTKRDQSLGDVIDAAKSHATTASAAAKVITSEIQDLLSFDATKQSMRDFNGTTNGQLKRDYLQRIATVIACGGNGNQGPDCADLQVNDVRLLGDLRERAIASNILCAKEVADLSKNQNAGGSVVAGGSAPVTVAAITKPVVDAVMQRVQADGKCS